MANPLKGEVGFEVEGVEYTLCLNFGAMATVEGISGRPFPEFAEGLSNPKTLRIVDLILLFWAGLQKHHSHIDKDRAGELMHDLGTMDVAIDLIVKAMTRGKQDAPSGRPQKPARQK
jgi:hypothetical protein